MAWTILDESWRSRIVEAAFDWAHPETDPRAELVKQNMLRRVYRVSLPDAVLYLKLHLRGGVANRVRDLLTGDPARREAVAGAYAAARGVPAVRIVAHGRTRRRDGTRVALSLSPAAQCGTEPAPTLLAACSAALGEPAVPGQRCRVDALLSAAARLLARAHSAALLHRDEHPGNILVRRDRDGKFAGLYVDLYGARCGRPVSDAEAARSLAALQQWFTTRTSRTQRLRALHVYLRERHGVVSRERIRGFARAVLRQTVRHAQSLYAQRDRRIGHNGALFAWIQPAPGWDALLTRRWRQPAALMPATPLPVDLETWRAWMAEWCRHLSDGAVVPADGAGVDLHSFRGGGLLARLMPKWMSSAWRRYLGALRAMHRDLPVSAPLAYLRQRRGLRVVQEACLLARPAGSMDLAVWLERNPQARARRRVLEQVGRLVADTAERGLLVEDLSLANLGLVADGADWRVYWTGIEVRGWRGPLPRAVVHWMLRRLLRAGPGAPGWRTLDAARILRSFARRQGLVHHGANWKALWRRGQKEGW